MIKKYLKLDAEKAFQIFHLLRQASSIFIAIALPHLGLGKAMIGNYEMLWFVGNTLSFFWVAGGIQALLTFYPGLENDQKKRLLFGLYVFFTLASLVIIGILWSGRGVLIPFFTSNDKLAYLGIFLVFILLNWPTYLVENFLLLERKTRGIIAFAALSFVGQFLVVVLPLWFDQSFEYSFWGLVALAGVKHLFLLIFLVRNAIFSFPAQLVKNWLFLSIPLMLYAFLGNLHQFFDFWLVGYFYDGAQEKFAEFKYGARELPLTLALASAFATAMLPKVTENLASSLTTIKGRSLRLMHILFPISIVLMLTSKWFFPWVFSEAFEESVVIFNIYLLIVVSRLIFSRTLLIGLKDNNTVLIISAIELAINIGLSVLLIHYFGLAGVAMATFIAYSSEVVMMGIYLFRKYKIRFVEYVSIGWYVVYTLLIFGAFLISLYI
ncbi:MAG: polysaccharide biosynthesis C-terminal domain-containing protein [Bacteroidota bacterium]